LLGQFALAVLVRVPRVLKISERVLEDDSAILDQNRRFGLAQLFMNLLLLLGNWQLRWATHILNNIFLYIFNGGLVLHEFVVVLQDLFEFVSGCTWSPHDLLYFLFKRIWLLGRHFSAGYVGEFFFDRHLLVDVLFLLL